MSVTILVGDVLDKLASLEDESVHCVVTSPPYWGLRDYGTDGQLGLEPTVEEYVEKMVAVFREVRRVLRKEGTLWLNMGDCYATSPPGNRPGTSKDSSGLPNSRENLEMRRSAQARKREYGKLKPKDLIGQPWRLAFALQADGWWLRSDIIWAKPNPMPESCRDRPTKAHEYIFLMTKAGRYFFDQDAIREPQTARNLQRQLAQPKERGDSRVMEKATQNYLHPLGRNAHSVWTIPTQRFPEAHFATFPEELPRRCIAAGTSEKGCCPKCGAPWVRVVEKTSMEVTPGPKGRVRRTQCSGTMTQSPTSKTTGWRCSCDCVKQKKPLRIVHETTDVKSGGSVWTVSDTPALPCTVLDPFSGAGTTGLVAVRMGRNYIGIELNPDYAEMSEKRIRGKLPLMIGD